MSDEKEIDPVDAHVGAVIKAIRTRKNISQSSLANDIGTSFQQLQKYEKGKNRVSASRLVKIARILEVTIEVFFPEDVVQGVEGSRAFAALQARCDELRADLDQINEISQRPIQRRKSA